MKLIILICITISLFGLVLIFKTSNPYYNPNKTHHTSTGFKNPYLKQDNQRKSFSDLFKMMTTERPNPNPQIEKKLNIDSMIQKINNNNNFITWVGHSTMLLHINGKTILTDPIFSDRCSPFQFLGPKRYSFPTIDIESLPKIDLIVISHNHYDHLDKNSVKNLGKDPLTVWYVPLGLKKWFDRLNIENVIELDWFEERKQDNVEIFCLPSQHWSKRSLFKSFDTLWSSWLIKVGNFKFWFAGDTGYNKIQFKVAFQNNISAFKRDLNFEISKVLISDLMKGNMSFSKRFGKASFTTIPKWFSEGAARYLAYGWDIEMDNILRDYFLLTDQKKIKNINNNQSEYIGQSMWNYISIKYGKSNISTVSYTHLTLPTKA